MELGVMEVLIHTDIFLMKHLPSKKVSGHFMPSVIPTLRFFHFASPRAQAMNAIIRIGKES
jgi:hypothetical protein